MSSGTPIPPSATAADALARLTADVTAEATADASAETLMNGLGAFITNLRAAALQAGATPAVLAAIDAQSAALEAATPGLTAAVTAGTTAEATD